jgi:hypothetical protein
MSPYAECCKKCCKTFYVLYLSSLSASIFGELMLSFIILSIVIQSEPMLNVLMVSVIMLSVLMLSAVMLSVLMLNAVMLIVVALDVGRGFWLRPPTFYNGRSPCGYFTKTFFFSTNYLWINKLERLALANLFSLV